MAKKVGRPSEMTPEAVKKLEEVFALDGTVEEACFWADISKTTYYNWLEKCPELVDRFEALRNKPVLLARKTVNEAIQVNPQIALTYLERKKKAEFGATQKIEHSGNVGYSLRITADDETNTMEADEQAGDSVEVS